MFRNVKGKGLACLATDLQYWQLAIGLEQKLRKFKIQRSKAYYRKDPLKVGVAHQLWDYV